ncbi:hypothetical protein F4778DRAFT_565475 [Xylariomycetidae sp. FL2044]|nr:hypothetical protein F4778DRAFT_565475 [Xylariomycetidae sp. FL2044]
MIRSLILAAAVPLTNLLVTAQTIEVDGEVVAATANNVGPAYETVDGFEGAAATQLTEAVLANLTDMNLSNISLFAFGDTSDVPDWKCKVFPGDDDWPAEEVWNVLHLLTDRNLLTTVPLGASCYEGEYYDAATCQNVLDNWTNMYLHEEDPTSSMWPLATGGKCLPENGDTGTCELGSFPPYSVKVTTVAQVQLAINFARNTGVRLVVRNTGHDYLGKSTGAGGLNIWTHNLKAMEFIQNYSSSSSAYEGPAFKIGAGTQVFELYEAANQYGVTAIGGEGATVGIAGGYTQGGGHSPLSSKYGMGVDQVLSIDVVTPDGQFLTADEANNVDLFWALRGGGGGTFGVVTGMTVKVYPKMSVSGMTLSISTGDGGVSDDVYWDGIQAYWRNFPEYADNGSYAFSSMFPNTAGGMTWSVTPWMIPEMALTDFQDMAAPLLAEWDTLGFDANISFFEHDNFYDVWTTEFATDTVGTAHVRQASRLFPRENWVNPSLLNETVDTIRGIIEEGSSLISYNINGKAQDDAPASAVTSAWREAYMFAIVGMVWDADASADEVEEVNVLIEDWVNRLRSLTPGGGTYLNEADIMEPDFDKAFFGYDNYLRLSSIKETVDPWGLMFAQTGVGSEKWYITDQEDWLTMQTGRLCPV